MSALLLIALAIAPAAAIIWYVYAKDLHEKESKKLLAIAFGFGILSIIPTMFGYLITEQWLSESSEFWKMAAYSFGVIALSEEVGKFLFLRFFLFKKKAFNEPYDGIIYSVMVSMGFATFENLLYVAEGGFGVGILRMFTAVPAHAVFGVIMGYWVGLAKFDAANRAKFMVFGLLGAIFLHGAYDLFLLQENYPVLMLVSFIGLYVAVYWSVKAIKKHNEISPFKPQADEYSES